MRVAFKFSNYLIELIFKKVDQINTLIESMLTQFDLCLMVECVLTISTMFKYSVVMVVNLISYASGIKVKWKAIVTARS